MMIMVMGELRKRVLLEDGWIGVVEGRSEFLQVEFDIIICCSDRLAFARSPWLEIGGEGGTILRRR